MQYFTCTYHSLSILRVTFWTDKGKEKCEGPFVFKRYYR